MSHPQPDAPNLASEADEKYICSTPRPSQSQWSYGWSTWFEAASFQPRRDFGRVKADEVPPLDEGDPTLMRETSDVTDLDAEVLGEGGDVHQVGQRVGGGHRRSPFVAWTVRELRPRSGSPPH